MLGVPERCDGIGYSTDFHEETQGIEQGWKQNNIKPGIITVRVT